MAVSYGPYTPVRRSGDLLFVSGQVGIDPSTKTAPKNAGEQTQQALKNMADTLRDVGGDLQNVIKTTVFLTNMDDFKEVNTVYETFFSLPRPARSTVCVKELPRIAGDTPIVVEIEAIAHQEAS